MHLWVRAEQRPNERRVGVTPDGVRALVAAGLSVTVEESADRIILTQGYADAGAVIAPQNSWPDAPRDAVVFGLKELPDDGTPLRHRHIMFGHAFKGQHAGERLLQRFRDGGGVLLDLEYLFDDEGRRVAAFGYWAGFAGGAVTLKAWCAQQRGEVCGTVDAWPDKSSLLAELAAEVHRIGRSPAAIVIGALGRVGAGAADLCESQGVRVTRWDMAETAHGGPFPEILEHELFFNCILARPGTPVFVPREALGASRRLTAIGDIACDPDSDYNPVPLYERATSWEDPVLRVHEDPPLDIMAIDNLPSLLPLESSEDYSEQLLPTLLSLVDMKAGVWERALHEFDEHAP
jgi:saccharopine dehydrogenase (NAD+, L-lysine-forming)